MTRTAAAAAENDPVERATPSAHEFEHGADSGRADQRPALGWALGVNAGLLTLELECGTATDPVT